jgi:hypothetical protein
MPFQQRFILKSSEGAVMQTCYQTYVAGSMFTAVT